MGSLLSKFQDKAYLSDQLFQFGCMMMAPAFLYSKSLITICTISILVAGLLRFQLDKLISFSRDYKYVIFSLVLVGLLVSVINSNNTQAWLQAINIKLPFILLPFGFYLVPRICIDKLVNFHLWLLAVLALSAIPQFIFIAEHQESLITALGKGQPIPTPVEHVKYSMINAYGIIAACYLLLFQSQHVVRWRHFITIGALIVFILMHLLAVRTGLIILYSSIGLLGLLYAIRQRKASIWLGLLTIIILTPFAAYKLVPSVHQKVNYMMHDWKMHQSGQGQDYADSQRWMMFDAGVDIWKTSPITGIGYGDLRDVSYTYYQDQLNLNDLQKLPHNQFLITLMGGGVLGLVIFLLGFYGPLWHYKGELRVLLLLLYLNYTLSFLVENSLERSVSVGFFLFFALLIISTRSTKQPYGDTATHH